jgi:protein-L-isoaspartate(D-aspartate) O-methyltransferase
MWRNHETREFVDWLRHFNEKRAADERVAFHGLDLYSMYSSIRAVLQYLDDVDPEAGALARERYACLTMWQPDPSTYARAALQGVLANCERQVLEMLIGLSEKRLEYTAHDGERYLDVLQNARLVTAAEEYYRTMYYGSRSSWNLRDSYMFDTLNRLLKYHGTGSKAIIWAHNSHVGDATATSMSDRGELNIGQLCREAFGASAYIVGFGTDFGTVAAASEWEGPMEIKTVQPSREGSYERLFHDVGLPGYFLPLRKQPATGALRRGLEQRRLERAIGVIYRPETELASHYFTACLPDQFDEYVWIDETRAVRPFKTAELEGLPDTYPFGL